MDKSRKGQVTLFIIIAVVLVAAVALFFIFRGSISDNKVPAEFESVYTNFLTCLEEDVLTGVDLLETQAGYIELPEFEAGSQHSPFSSQLNFLGNPIPYWYYVSGNNIQKTQVPSKSEMESQLEGFVEDKISGCSFENFYDDGYGIYFGSQPNADIRINEGEVELNLDLDLNLESSGQEVLVSEHDVVVDSNLGGLYDSALEVYNEEQENLFLEEYAVDTLRLYAPVDGFEISCSPQIWNADEVFDDLQEAIEVNTFALGTHSNDDYYELDFSTDKEVRFVNSRNWANNFEVNPSEGNFLISSPVGNQEGLGVLGFCYVAYHYVYNVKYPVLVQVYDDTGETFQFPLAVVVEGNVPRESLSSNQGAVEVQDIGLCENKNTPTTVNVYDSDLNFIDADVSYECFGNSCYIGSTESGSMEEDFPQCVNGNVVVRADGFREKTQQYTSLDSGVVNVVLDRLHTVGVDLKVDGLEFNSGEAIINFASEGYSKSVIYSEQDTVELVEGDYEISVYVYEDSELEIDETTYEQCVEVPRGAIGGIFGLTKEECFEVDAPSRLVSNALSGGGVENYYVSEFELQDSNFIEINAGSLKSPDTLEDLQENYRIFESKGLEVSFR